MVGLELLSHAVGFLMDLDDFSNAFFRRDFNEVTVKPTLCVQVHFRISTLIKRLLPQLTS